MQEKGPTWRLDRVFKTYDMGEVEGGELSSWVPADPARAPSSTLSQTSPPETGSLRATDVTLWVSYSSSST